MHAHKKKKARAASEHRGDSKEEGLIRRRITLPLSERMRPDRKFLHAIQAEHKASKASSDRSAFRRTSYALSSQNDRSAYIQSGRKAILSDVRNQCSLQAERKAGRLVTFLPSSHTQSRSASSPPLPDWIASSLQRDRSSSTIETGAQIRISSNAPLISLTTNHYSVPTSPHLQPFPEEVKPARTTNLSLVGNHSTPFFAQGIVHGFSEENQSGNPAPPKVARLDSHETPSIYNWQMNKLAGLKTPICHSSFPQAHERRNRQRAQTACFSRPSQCLDRYESVPPSRGIFALPLQHPLQGTYADTFSNYPPHTPFEASKQDADIVASPNVYLSQMNKLYRSQSQLGPASSSSSSSPLLRNTQKYIAARHSEPSLQLQEVNNCLQWPRNRHLMMLQSSQESNAREGRRRSPDQQHEPSREIFAPVEVRPSNATSSPLHGGTMTVTSLQASPTPSPDWSSRPVRPLHTFASQHAPIELSEPQLQSDRNVEIKDHDDDEVGYSDYDDLFRGLRDEDFDEMP